MRTHPFFRFFTPLLTSLGLAGLMVAILFITVANAADEIFWVDSGSDAGDNNWNDCICRTTGGECTLRAAIEEANACSGGQTIRFSSGITLTFTPATPLPAIVDDYTVIDGGDEWYDWSGMMVPGVTIDGASLAAANGLVINASHCAIYGLKIVDFDQHGIYISGVAEDNHIGGEGDKQRNILTRNGQNGVKIDGVDAINNVVSSNFVGTNEKGYYELGGGNGQHGVSVWYGEGNVITANLVSFNKWSGVTMDAVNSGTIVNNHIGMDILGGSLPNTYYGVHIGNGAKPQITNNHIAFNKRGILVIDGSQAFIEGNEINNNSATSLPVPDGGGVLITGTTSHADLFHNNIHDNSALFGGGIAIEDGASGLVEHNTIQNNEAVIYTSGSLGGGGIYVDSSMITATNNTIISNTAVGPNGPSFYGFPNGGGVLLNKADPAWLIGTELRGNSVIGNAGGGGGVKVIGGGNIWINNNMIYDNYVNTASYAGSGIDTNTLLGVGQINIDSNRVEENSTNSGGAVYIFNSDYVNLTNNLIVNNHDHGLYLQDNGAHIDSNFNTIVRNSGSGILLDNSFLYFNNSLVISNTQYGIEAVGSLSMGSSHDNVWGNILGDSNPSVSFYMSADPLFFNADMGDFALLPASPCIDKGNDGYPVSSSYNGVRRPIGAGYDIGAYEMPLPTYLPVLLR